MVDERSVSRWQGWGLAAASLIVVVTAVWLSWQPSRLDLLPDPDGPEYMAGAVSLAGGEGYTIHVAGKRFPPRYPFGYSLTMVPLLWLGVEPAMAPLIISFVSALVLLCLVWAGARASGGRTAAGLAVLLLVTTPLFVLLARTPMADLSSTCMVVASVLALARFHRTERVGWGLVGALILGVSACFRLGNILFLPLLALSWWVTRKRLDKPVRVGAWMTLVLILGMSPLLLYQWKVFGQPLSNGYAFWLPHLAGFSDTFEIGNLPGNLRYLLRDALQLEWKRTVATYYGDGSYFGPAHVLLLAVCWFQTKKTAAFKWLAVGLGAYVLVMLFYFFPDARFHAPVVILMPIFVGPALVEILRNSKRGWRLVALALFCMCVVGFPGTRSVFATPHLVFDSRRAPAERFDLVDRLRSEPPGLVLSTFSEPYVRGLLGRDWVVSPALPEHGYGSRPDLFVYGESQRRRQLEEFIALGKPVYVLADQNLHKVDSLVLAEGQSWTILASQHAQGGLASLVHRD